MNTKIEEIDGNFIATLEGEMDTAAATEAEEVLKRMHVKTKEEILNEKSLHESLMQKKDDIETKLFNIFNDGLEVDDEI